MQSSIFSHTEIKRLYRFFVLREYLHSCNTSGLYKISVIRQCAAVTGISYNTLRLDINWFARIELLVKANGLIKLNVLKKPFKSIASIFDIHRHQIAVRKNPAIFLADLYKSKIIFGNFLIQAYKIAEEIKDEKLRKKYLKSVRSNKTLLGERQGIFFSIRTTGKLFNKCSTTGWKYIERLHGHGILERKKNYAMLFHVSRINEVRQAENLYGKLTIRDGIVYERLQNSYRFNF